MILQIQPEYKEYPFWEELAEQENLHFEILELSMPIVAEFIGEEGRNWYRKLQRVTSLHGNFMDNNPASSDPQVAELSVKKLEESCQLAVELHIPRVVFHSGAFPFLRGIYLEKWAETAAGVFDRLAEKYDLEILIENSQDVDPQPLAELMARTKDPRVGVCLDIGHANYSREPLEEWFYKLESHIRYIHLSDNMGMFDDHMILGTGTVNWEAADRLAKGLKGDIPVTLETGSPEKTMASIRFLKEHGYFGF